MAYRFRADAEGKLVLQVSEYHPGYGYESRTTWRDATIADIPVNDPFERPRYDNNCGNVTGYAGPLGTVG